ncbi:MAG: twin-arginine translocation signal domain-containing protein, partial [Phycisphaeraceae bacterium]
MSENVPSLPGRDLLNRRGFLSHTGTGAGAMALLHLLGRDGLLADKAAPIRPTIDASAPAAPRLPHHTAKAQQVLVIFCSGALSHMDTFDYKP